MEWYFWRCFLNTRNNFHLIFHFLLNILIWYLCLISWVLNNYFWLILKLWFYLVLSATLIVILSKQNLLPSWYLWFSFCTFIVVHISQINPHIYFLFFLERTSELFIISKCHLILVGLPIIIMLIIIQNLVIPWTQFSLNIVLFNWVLMASL